MGSGHDLDQCGFSRAVLSAQRVDLTLADVKRDAVQRPDAGEDLHDVFELDKYLALAQSDSPFLRFIPKTNRRAFADRFSSDQLIKALYSLFVDFATLLAG